MESFPWVMREKANPTAPTPSWCQDGAALSFFPHSTITDHCLCPQTGTVYCHLLGQSHKKLGKHCHRGRIAAIRMGRQQSLSHLPVTPWLPQDPNKQTAVKCEGEGSLNVSVLLAGRGRTVEWGWHTGAQAQVLWGSSVTSRSTWHLEGTGGPEEPSQPTPAYYTLRRKSQHIWMRNLQKTLC